MFCLQLTVSVMKGLIMFIIGRFRFDKNHQILSDTFMLVYSFELMFII